MNKFIRFSAILLLAISVASCKPPKSNDVDNPSSDVVEIVEYATCSHIIGNITIKFNPSNVEVFTMECPDYLLNPYGECPTVIRIQDINGEYHHLSGLEVDNYVCDYPLVHENP